MPGVASVDALHRAVTEFGVTDPGLVIEPSALAAARRSLDSSGLLLLGETHGVQENPLLIRALMLAFGLTSLALEWPEELAPVIRAYLAGKTLPDHPWLWGDRSQDRLPMRKHPHCGSDSALQLGTHGAESASTRSTPDLPSGPRYL
jgi:hypothetical protein